MLDWGHMADACDSWDWRRVANVPFAWRQTHSNISPLTVSTRRRCINGKPGSMASKPYCTTKADIGTARHGGWTTQERKYSPSFVISMLDIPTSYLSGAGYGHNLYGTASKIVFTAPPQAGDGPKTTTGNSNQSSSVAWETILRDASGTQRHTIQGHPTNHCMAQPTPGK